MTGDKAGTPTVLVIGQSARALVASARRAGFRAIAIDHFADTDTAAEAAGVYRYPGGLRCGFRRALLVPMVERAVADAGGIDALVLGSGFEDRPRLVETLAARWPVTGSSPETIRRVKDPFELAAACDEAGIPHPEVALSADGKGWLRRRRGASGGWHVRPHDPGDVLPTGHVLTRTVPGSPVSATVIADGASAAVVGFCRQSLAPTEEMPYRFGGIAGPVRLPATVETGLTDAASALTRRFGLRGLFSLDAIADDARWWLLEVNPRPGASLDVLDRTHPPLLAAHLAAAAGRLTVPLLPDATIRATRVVYASSDSRVPATVAWPEFVLDRPAAGTRIRAGEPLATVIAEAADLRIVNECLDNRARDLPLLLEGNAR